MAALERALRTDAEIEPVGTPIWFAGRVTCLRFLARVIGSPGAWRMVPASANGQPAVAAYRLGGEGRTTHSRSESSPRLVPASPASTSSMAVPTSSRASVSRRA
ncbi:hypothetical protein AB0I28_14405 [Phytomonospora sp. NPDC050363]|uniref:hypothetical protein n=1 Tax=Phytomonospora sp. NPDC050363 TaxID=3155642 RepID=UPI0033C9F92E